MTKILGGKIAKFATLLIAALLVLTASLAFVGCETKRPEISMKITFNGETYELEYVLYRNVSADGGALSRTHRHGLL